MRALIVLPTYNEIDNVASLLHRIFEFLPAAEVLVIDDGSPDGTGDLVDELCRSEQRLHVVHRSCKLGLGTAYLQGFRHAIDNGYDVVFEMDADFSHDPKVLPQLLKAATHADLVIGSRYVPGGSTPDWSLIRRFVSHGGNIFARAMLGIPIHDCTGGFRCYRVSALARIDLDLVRSEGYAFQVEMAYHFWKHDFKIFELPITFLDRRVGQSKMSKRIVIEAIRWVVSTRFSGQAVLASPGSRNCSLKSAKQIEAGSLGKLSSFDRTR